ncbi:MAG: hypothetical protein ABW033_11905 [Acidimicrobiia bacterium]
MTDGASGEPVRGGSVDLYWIPLGSGAHLARLGGRLYEAASARAQRRRSRDLYHSALVVHVPEGQFVVEQTPVPDRHGERRGVVATGAVGIRSAKRFRLFRYEIRRWRDGEIPDMREAVASPVRVADDILTVRRVLEVVASVPTPTWGRDELHAGEMWNSNSITAWVLTTSGIDASNVHPPEGGRAPGWDAGIVVAGRRDCVTGRAGA